MTKQCQDKTMASLIQVYQCKHLSNFIAGKLDHNI